MAMTELHQTAVAAGVVATVRETHFAHLEHRRINSDAQSASATPPTSSNKLSVPIRYIFTVLVSIGLAIIYGLKVSLSVAIVMMVNNTALMLEQNNRSKTEQASFSLIHLRNDNNTIELVSMTTKHDGFACPEIHEINSSNSSPATTIQRQQDGPFEWSEPTQGLILAAYFWGYIFTQLPGGRVAEMFSAKWVIWGSVMVNVVFTVLTPVAAQISYIAVLVVRFIEGLGAGVSIPAIHVMLSKWALPQERNVITNFTYAGMSLGTVISLPMSGYLASAFGWQSVFYVQGGLSAIWCIVWIFMVYDSPQQHPRIDANELNLFETCMNGSIGHHHSNLSVPWKAVFTSLPFWAILVAQTCNNFGWYMLLVELPTYMKHILRFNIGQNALLSAVPYLCMWIFSVFWSLLLDWTKNTGRINTTTVRKLSTGIASLLPAACFVGVGLVGCNRNAAVILMTIGTMFMAGMYCGFLSNHIDIASNYAGTLMALTNTAATIPGFIVPVFVGEMTHGNQSLERWEIIFGTTAGVLFIELVVYTLLASGEEQPWNRILVTAADGDAKHTSQKKDDSDVNNEKATVYNFTN